MATDLQPWADHKPESWPGCEHGLCSQCRTNWPCIPVRAYHQGREDVVQELIEGRDPDPRYDLLRVAYGQGRADAGRAVAEATTKDAAFWTNGGTGQPYILLADAVLIAREGPQRWRCRARGFADAAPFQDPGCTLRKFHYGEHSWELARGLAVGEESPDG